MRLFFSIEPKIVGAVLIFAHVWVRNLGKTQLDSWC